MPADHKDRKALRSTASARRAKRDISGFGAFIAGFLLLILHVTAFGFELACDEVCLLGCEGLII